MLDFLLVSWMRIPSMKLPPSKYRRTWSISATSCTVFFLDSAHPASSLSISWDLKQVRHLTAAFPESPEGSL